MEFPSAEHEKVYDFYLHYFTHNPYVQYVHGNGKSLIVYRKSSATSYGLGLESEALLASIYEYGKGNDGKLTMLDTSCLLVTSDLAPLFYDALNPENFNEQIAAFKHPTLKKSQTNDAFTRYAESEHLRTPETFLGYAVPESFGAENIMVAVYRELASLRVVVNGYKKKTLHSKETGIVSVGTFTADAEISGLIRSSLVEFFDTLGVEGDSGFLSKDS